MKRSDLVSLSRAAIDRLTANKIGVIKGTPKQIEKLGKQKKKKEQAQ
jgi:hypothetical protein